MTFTMIFTWISSLPCLFLFKFKILNQKGILWMVLSSHESKLAIFPQKKPDPTNQVTPFDLFFFPPWISHGLQAGSVWPVWHCALLWFGCGEGAGNRKKGSVEEFLWIELPIGNRDTFCVGCLFTSLPGALWGWECGVDFGVSSKFQGVSSNLLLLKLVTLPSSSLQTCQNPDLLPPFFFGTAVSKFWTLQMWSKKCVARFGSQESGCQGAGGGVATRFVGSQVAGSWWMIRLLGGEESPVLILGCEGRANEDASCLNKMLIYETCGCVSINSLSVPELCWVLL